MTNDITLSQAFTGAGTGNRAKVIAPNLVVQATPGLNVTIEGTNFPDEASSWQPIGTHSTGYTPTSLATSFAWMRVQVDAAGDVRISGAQATTGAGGGGGGGGGAVTVANGADVTQGAIADAAAAPGATGTLSAKLRTLTAAAGAPTDTEAAADGTGNYGLIAALKRGLLNWFALLSRLPAALGPQASAASLSVVPATGSVQAVSGFQAIPTATFNRPADTVAYAVGDLVANSTTAGSVAPMQLTAARVAAGSFILRRLRLRKSGASLTNASFRVHLFNAAPTVANGDNGVLSMTGAASYIGAVDITMTQGFTDGAFGDGGITAPEFNIALASGQAIFGLLEARAAYTPLSGETFALTAEVLQN